MAQDKLLAEWFWIDRWVGSSAFLLPAEARGVYREMLTQAWRRGAALPNDHDAIRRVTAVTKREWARTWPRLERYWRVEGDTLVNDTQLEVYAACMARSLKASARALKGAQARIAGQREAQLKHSSSSLISTAQAPLKHIPLDPDPDPSLIVVPTELLASALAVELSVEALDLRAGHLVERYAELFYQHRHGARYHSRIHLDFLKAQELVRTWADDGRLEKLAVLILTTDDDWIAHTDRGFAIFATKATWADDKLKAWEREHGVVV